ncbi:LysR family transcriptional regulator [Pseudonocardia humida]|uniref:LysR family transcriptional regulator n=1 Tax=Pseudonocardia humida TaxID=2800819 RepID=A0ABT0ZTQ3_9PSEU|nr:LysR family transcriptional regulator [Pseudonocardia humida]MCO1654097.1 LysR family transcriptional regulator [Pseudonocardia humida]
MRHKLALSGAVLDVRRLRVLVEIDRCGSFSAAATALGMSQPAASQHVAALEHAVGLALVERGSRPVALTEAGHALVRHARGVLLRIDAAEQELAEMAGRRSARLRLGGFPTALSTLVPHVLAEYGRLRPDVTLSVVGDHMQRLLPRLHAGELDLALIYDDPTAPATHPPGFDTVALFDDPFTAVVPPGHRLAQHTAVTLRELADDTWIGGTPTSTWFAIVRRACHAAGFEPRAPFSTDDYVAVQAFVAAGLGVAVIPSLAVGPTAHAVRALALPRPGPSRRIGVALPPDAVEHSAAQTMIELLRRDGRRHRDTRPQAPA